MKTALLMEGGAMRGMFTCGVMDVLMENGIVFDGAAGISAGAVFGCNFKSRQIGRPIRYNKKYAGCWRYCSLRSLLQTGDLYGADFCYRVLPDTLDPFDRKAFRENPMAFWVGATDVETGKAVWHLCADGKKRDMEWLRASASMPFVSRPVPVDGMLLLDGGIAEAVPVSCMREHGYDRNVLILTQPKGYRKKRRPRCSFCAPPSGAIRRRPLPCTPGPRGTTGRWRRSTGRRRPETSWSSVPRRPSGSGAPNAVPKRWTAFTASGAWRRSAALRRSGPFFRDPDARLCKSPSPARAAHLPGSRSKGREGA